MSKRKALETLSLEAKCQNKSSDIVYYQSALQQKIRKISQTKIGKQPIYQFFIDYDEKYFPLRCILDLGSTSFSISQEAAKVYTILVVQRMVEANSTDITRRNIQMQGLFTVPLGLSFGNHHFFDEEDHAFEVMKTSGDYDALIPAWHPEKHKARGTTTSH